MDGFRILRELRDARSSLRARALLTALAVSCFLFALPALAAGLLDRTSPWREGTCFHVVVAFATVAVLTFLALVIVALRKAVDVRALARQVENHRPELMNALSSALELVDGRGPEHPIHHALLADLDANLSSEAVRESINEGRMKIGSLLALILLAAGIMGVAHFMPFGHKARAHAFDWMKGANTGVTVTPGTVDVAESSDVRVEVRINRGPADEAWIVLTENGKTQRFQMTGIAGDRFEFEIFGVRETLDYRIFTPTLSSDRHRLRVFKRPTLEDVEIRVVPPIYTRLEPSTHSGFQPLTVPQGSMVTLAGRPNAAALATLVIGAREVPFALKDGVMSATVVAARDDDYSVHLENADGHGVDLGPWPLSTIDDMPPLIKVLVPDKETHSVPPGKKVPVVAECSDDYGVGTVRLCVNRNGGGWKTRVLATEKTPGELAVTTVDTISIEDSQVGDVFVYYLEAVDFAEPTPNVSRSGVRFIEIRPEDDDKSADGDGGGGQKPPDDTLTVADLIMRTKALIRETFSLDLVAPEQREQALLALTGTSADLFLDAKRRYQKLKQKADEQQMSLGLIGELFEAAVVDLEKAYGLMGKSLPIEASGHHQAALGALIRIEVALAKQMKKKKGKGEGEQSGKPSESKPKTPEERKQAEKQRQDKVDQVQKTISQINELLAREAGIRRKMEQLADLPAAARKNQVAHVGRTQKDVAETTGKLADEVTKTLTEAPDLGTDLKRALLQMQQAGRRMDANAPADAKSNALRAEAFLKRAKSRAEALRRALSGGGMDKAIADLEGMIKRQGDLAGAARDEAAKPNPSRERSRQLANEQDATKKAFDGLLKKLAAAGEELDERTPGAAKAMEKILAESGASRIGGNMTRATNALKYGKPGRAVGAQDSARKGMEAMSESLKTLRKELGKATPEQLAAMLETMMKNLEALDKAGKGKLSGKESSELSNKVGKDAREISDLVKNNKLQRLSQEIMKAGAAGADGRLAPEVEGLTAKFCEVLERELFNALMQRKVSRAGVREGGVPESYRKLVESYFKALAEDRDVEEQ